MYNAMYASNRDDAQFPRTPPFNSRRNLASGEPADLTLQRAATMTRARKHHQSLNHSTTSIV